MNVVLRLVKSLSGPPLPGSRYDGPGQASPIQTNKLRVRFPTSTVTVFGWTAAGPVLEQLLYANENGGAGGE